MIPTYFAGDKDVQISGYIDQGGATSENNTAYQININIILPAGLGMEEIRNYIHAVFEESKKALRP